MTDWAAAESVLYPSTSLLAWIELVRLCGTGFPLYLISRRRHRHHHLSRVAAVVVVVVVVLLEFVFTKKFCRTLLQDRAQQATRDKSPVQEYT